MLRLSGHDVTVAYDGTAALRAAEARRPDIAFLDIGLPDMDGYELAARLRPPDDHRGRTMLVALTGWGREADRRRSAEAGFDHHLVKPVQFSALQRLLTEVPVAHASPETIA